MLVFIHILFLFWHLLVILKSFSTIFYMTCAINITQEHPYVIKQLHLSWLLRKHLQFKKKKFQPVGFIYFYQKPYPKTAFSSTLPIFAGEDISGNHAPKNNLFLFSLSLSPPIPSLLLVTDYHRCLRSQHSPAIHSNHSSFHVFTLFIWYRLRESSFRPDFQRRSYRTSFRHRSRPTVSKPPKRRRLKRRCILPGV